MSFKRAGGWRGRGEAGEGPGEGPEGTEVPGGSARKKPEATPGQPCRSGRRLRRGAAAGPASLRPRRRFTNSRRRGRGHRPAPPRGPRLPRPGASLSASVPGPLPGPNPGPAAPRPGLRTPGAPRPLRRPRCPASHLRGGCRGTRGAAGTAKLRGAAAAAGRRVSAPGRSRGAGILEGLGGQQARGLTHHVPQGLVCRCSAASGAAPSAGDRRGNSAERAPGRHFVTPSRLRPIRKGRKETPASGYCASALQPGSAGLARRGRGVARRMRPGSRKPSPGEASVSHACARRPQPGTGARGRIGRTLVTWRPPRAF